MAPWVEAAQDDEDGVADDVDVDRAIEARRKGLTAGGIGEAELARFAETTLVRVLTPGSDAGEPVHLLSALECRSHRWDTDVQGARTTLSAAVSLVLRLLGRDGDPGKSRDHALLSVLAEARLMRGETANLAQLLGDLISPPVANIGELPIDAFVPPRARAELAADLNTLIASPSFASWRRGQAIDVAAWMQKVNGKTPATIVSVAHLDDEERALVLGVLLEEVLSWVRGLPGSARLKALVVFDEVYGFVPPHPANPPTKKPLVALMKRRGLCARDAKPDGLGLPRALECRHVDARSIADRRGPCARRRGLGRRQAEFAGFPLGKESSLGNVLKQLAPRWFVVREAKQSKLTLLQPRWAMSYLRGPMTQVEIRRARSARDVVHAEVPQAAE